MLYSTKFRIFICSFLSLIIILFSFTVAKATTWYSVRVYNQSGQQTYEFMATSDSGYYNVDQVINDPESGGYKYGYSDYKACAFETSTSAVRVRFGSNTAFNPKSTANVVGDGRANKKSNIRSAQTALYYLHWNSSDNIDGSWGPKTKQAVTSFQGANKLSVDGVIGPQTWMKLASNGASAEVALLGGNQNDFRSTIVEGYKLNPQSEDVWNKVRDIIVSNSYQRDKVEQSLRENSFNIDYHYIEDGAEANSAVANDVIGFSVVDKDLVIVDVAGQ